MTMQDGLRVASPTTGVKLVVTKLTSRPHVDEHYENDAGRQVAMHPAVYVTTSDTAQRAIGLDVPSWRTPDDVFDRYVERYAAEVVGVLDDVWRQFGYDVPDEHVARYDRKAGCGCGCSPGFVLQPGPARDAARNFWLTIELDEVENA